MEVVILEKSPIDIKNEFASKLSNLRVGDDFETLLKVKEENTIVHIAKKKERENGSSNVYVLVVDNDVIVSVKFSGDFSEDDIKNIVEDQKKNIG